MTCATVDPRACNESHGAQAVTLGLSATVRRRAATSYAGQVQQLGGANPLPSRSSISLITAFLTGQTRIPANGSNYRVIRHQRVAFCPIQKLVISSSDLPFVSGISHPTSTIVSKAPPLNTQNVPSDPNSFCITGNIWFPR